jgi:FAD/FMN-containing dehydrogenase
VCAIESEFRLWRAVRARGLSGGALPVKDGVVISLARMNRILEVDLPNARMVVEPGVINLEVTGRVAPSGFFYAPDPSSQRICSIGGNVAENAGGAHCLKYGFTTTHVLGLEVVLPDGSNPTKVFPRPRLCGETPGEYRPHPLEVAGIAERF